MQKSTVRSIEDENKALASKLQKLQQQKSQVIKSTTKPKLQPFSRKAFIPSMTEYTNISPNDFNTVLQQHNQKLDELKKQKDEAELAQCTFKPQINKSTAKYIDMQNYIPVHERVYESQSMMDMTRPDEYIDEEDIERKERTSRKIDPNFYEKQIEWKKQQMEKLTRKKLNEELNSTKELTGMPKINKKGFEIEGSREDFVERMEHHKQKTEFKKKQLEERIYNYSFKPRVNPNPNTQPLYNKPKKYTYQNLSSNYTFKEGN